MASENETVEAALEAIGELATKLYDKEKVAKCDIKDVWSLVQQAKSRIEVAWRREKDELESKRANTETARKFFARRTARALVALKAKELREAVNAVRAYETDGITQHKLAEVVGECNWCEREYGEAEG